jgi:hypothetical protein
MLINFPFSVDLGKNTTKKGRELKKNKNKTAFSECKFLLDRISIL